MSEKTLKILVQDTEANLYVHLTQAEAVARAEAASEAIEERSQVEGEFDEVKKDYKDRIGALDQKISDLSRAHNSKREWQKVICTQSFCLATKETWWTYRSQNYDKRKMADHEIARVVNKPMFDENGNAIDPPKLQRIGVDYEKEPALGSDLAQVIAGETNRKSKKDISGV